MPVERLKLEDVDKAEGILQAIRETLDKSEQSQQNLKKYSDEFYSRIPHREKSDKEINCERVIFVRYVLIGLECLTRFLVVQDNKFTVILLFIF